jgi:uncharacterized protein (DUF1499 family)
MKHRLVTACRLLVLAAAFAAVALLLVSGLGNRFGWWPYRTGFEVLRWASYVGLAAAAVAIVALAVPRLRSGWARVLIGALGVGVAVAYVPWQWQERAQSLPRIHDITTDTANPPQFVAVLPLRAGAPNTAAYGGKEIAEQQLKGYPDIGPLALSVPPGVAFGRARDAAESMGWEIVAADPAAGRIEATTSTLWFGFKDDIVVRVSATEQGSRIDVRSVSRVGRSDVGTNAKRIREYLAKLRG